MASSNKVKYNSTKVLKVMKILSEVTQEDIQTASPLTITYVANKQAKVVRCTISSEQSTDDE